MEGRVVLVTGGANGIGASIVKRFSAEGYRVCFCDCDRAAGESLAESCSAYFTELDVRDEDALQEWFERSAELSGGVDVLVNNVGVSEFKPLTEISIEEFDRVLSINLRPVFILSRTFAIYRSRNPKECGRIINISSTRYLQSEPGSEAYAASKGGVVSITHALAISLAEYSITVNSISPGWIETGDYESLTESDHLQHPSCRVGKVDDVADMCLYLASPKSGFINGQNITIDGGMTKKMIYE